jgi:hypothetical protein
MIEAADDLAREIVLDPLVKPVPNLGAVPVYVPKDATPPLIPMEISVAGTRVEMGDWYTGPVTQLSIKLVGELYSTMTVSYILWAGSNPAPDQGAVSGQDGQVTGAPNPSCTGLMIELKGETAFMYHIRYEVMLGIGVADEKVWAGRDGQVVLPRAGAGQPAGIAFSTSGLRIWIERRVP